MMLFLLTVLIDTITPTNPLVSIGEGFGCDFEPTQIKQVITEHQHVALTNQVIWPAIEINHSINITGGFDNCLNAKLGIISEKQSQINGNGLHPAVLIDAQELSTAKIILENLHLKNGKNLSGGGIKAMGRFQLMVNRLLIEDNLAESKGGGLFVLGNNNSLSIKHSLIKNNHADQGGGLAVAGTGNSITILNTIIHQNLAESSGGGIICDGNNLIQTNQSNIGDNKALLGSNFFRDLRCQYKQGLTPPDIGTMEVD